MKTVIISALTMFIYVAGGAFILSIFILRKYGDKPDWMIISACVIFGAMAAAKDVRATMRMPPIEGNVIDMNQLRQLIENSKK